MTTAVQGHLLPVSSGALSQAVEDVFFSEPAATAKNHGILVVDDAPINLKVIRAHLSREGYERIETVEDSREAMAALFREDPDLLILDLMMPHVSGLDILQAVRATHRFRRLPVIVVSAAEQRELKRKSFEFGATDYLSKPVDAEDLILRVRNTIELKSYQDRLEEGVFRRTAELEQSRGEVIHCLARAAEYRDNETGNHVIRVGRYAGLVASRMGMDAGRVHMLELASTLHDMGKIGIPDAILRKPGALTDDEFTRMKEHCEFGEKICTADRGETPQLSSSTHVVVGAMMLGNSVSPLLRLASRIALTHHERWDGEGYPRGLRGEEIPIEGRITAVADVFDAISSRRPYKPAFPLDKCFSIIEEDAGKHFDPRVVETFLARKSDVISVYNTYRDE